MYSCTPPTTPWIYRDGIIEIVSSAMSRIDIWFGDIIRRDQKIYDDGSFVHTWRNMLHSFTQSKFVLLSNEFLNNAGKWDNSLYTFVKEKTKFKFLFTLDLFNFESVHDVDVLLHVYTSVWLYYSAQMTRDQLMFSGSNSTTSPVISPRMLQ